MNNVIPLKCPEHLLPDDEFEALVAEVSHISQRYAGFQSLPAAIRKTLSDALKHDRHGPDLISTPDHVIDEKFREKFSLRETISELQALIEKQGGYNFDALREERDDGEANVPVA